MSQRGHDLGDGQEVLAVAIALHALKERREVGSPRARDEDEPIRAPVPVRAGKRRTEPSLQYNLEEDGELVSMRREP